MKTGLDRLGCLHHSSTDFYAMSEVVSKLPKNILVACALEKSANDAIILKQVTKNIYEGRSGTGGIDGCKSIKSAKSIKVLNDQLEFACTIGDKNLVEFLIAKGATDVNRGLLKARHYNHQPVVKLLITSNNK